MATRQADTGNRGMQVLLIVVVLVLLLTGVWYFFIRADAPEETALPTVPSAPVPTPEPTQDARPGTGPVETFEVFAPKDPFKPAIAAAGAGGGTTGTPTTGGSPGTTGGITGGSGTGTTGGSTSGGGTDRGDSVGGHRVRLVDVFRSNGAERARVQVDGTVYTVREDDRFADNFEVLSIEGQCASLLFGDDQFTLCEGEEILK